MVKAQLAQDKTVSKLMLESKLKFSGTQNDSTATASCAKATAHLWRGSGGVHHSRAVLASRFARSCSLLRPMHPITTTRLSL